jgi:putative ABC transport system permease protein
MRFARQFFALLRLNVASLGGRIGAVLTIIIGVTCAVGVLVAMLSMSTGVRRQALGNVRDDRLFLVPAGSRSSMNAITRDQADAALNLPYLRRGSDGKPLVLLEAFVPVQARRRGTGVHIYFPLLGVSSNVLDFYPEVHLTEGRMFKPGLQELIASKACSQFVDFELNDKRSLHGMEWPIVGRFTEGNNQQCTVYTDVNVLMSVFVRNSYSRVAVRLQSASDAAAFGRAVADDPNLKLEAMSERQMVENNTKEFTQLLNFVSFFVGSIMALGATLGAVNSLYAIVDARRRELATLRAIGFGSPAILASVLCESVLLALPGAALGCLLAWSLFDRMAVSPFGFTFGLAVTPALALLGVEWALAMGFVGGLLPALRAARVPVTAALRAT